MPPPSEPERIIVTEANKDAALLKQRLRSNIAAVHKAAQAPGEEDRS